MSIRRSRFTNIMGKQVEFAVDLEKPEDRHFHRESESTASQLESKHRHGRRKDVKTKMKRKLT